uniref:C2H2-type domain-containing protein n=1 Tax=Neogobius melanostomus TaxID=47308 RepID=A0A8C6SEM4_9GOBI
MAEKGQMFRALVNERLTAAAEEIFLLFQRTVVEYEEELRRFREENQRKQRLLEEVTAAQYRTLEPEVKVTSPDDDVVEDEDDEVEQDLDDNETETTIVKEEYVEASIKQEQDDQLQGHEQLQGFRLYSRKSDEEPPCSSSFRHAEAEVDVDYFSQVYMQALDHNDHSARKSAMRPPKCPECEQEFDDKEELQNHMLEVHGGDKPISCPVCSRTFTRNGSLKLHMAMHMHEKPFTCPVCNRGFTQKGNLRSHMAQHTGEKPFGCTECDARFPIKRTLLRHMQLHTGERPYSCPYCDKSFTRKEHVRLHMAVHTGETKPKKRRVQPTRGAEAGGTDASNDSSGALFYGSSSNE